MWEIFTVSISIYNVVMIPLEISFGPNLLLYELAFIFDQFIDIVFLFDLIIMFFTSYVDQIGAEITDSHMIAFEYMSTRRFYFDVASLLGTAPMNAINKNFKYLQLFKVFRVFRVGELIAKSNTSKEIKALMNLGKIFFYLVMYLHNVACLWHLVLIYNAPDIYFKQPNNTYLNAYEELYKDFDGNTVYSNTTFKHTNGTIITIDDEHQYDSFFGDLKTFDQQTWTRATNSPNDTHGLAWKKFNDGWAGRSSQWFSTIEWVNIGDSELFQPQKSKSFRYSTMLYYSLMILGVGEMGPVNTEEYLFLIFALLFSLML